MNGRLAERQLIAAALIAAGVLWLLVSSGFIPSRMIAAFWSFWPLLPIGIGLDLLLKRRVLANIPYTAVAIVIMLLFAAWPGTSAAPFEERFSEPIGAAQRVTVALDLGPAPTTAAAHDGDALLTADIVDNAEVVLSREGDREPRIRLERRTNRRPFAAPLLRSSWELGLTTALPLELEVDGGSGGIALDLRRLQLERLSYDGGSGAGSLTLPRAPAAYQADFDLGSGATTVEIENDAELSVRAETGSGSSRWTVGRGARLELILGSGSGSVTIDLPDGDPILLRVEDDGSGRLSVPAFLERQQGSGDLGEWRSGGEPRIVVTLTDVGSGSVAIR